MPGSGHKKPQRLVHPLRSSETYSPKTRLLFTSRFSLCRGRTMFSKPDIQRVLETAFLPSKCECVVASDETFSVKLLHPESGDIQLYVKGLSLSEVESSRYIARLVLSLREQRDLMGLMDLSMRRLA
ncbi:hypothetical protein ALO62_100489 [Pseudomonas amygdali pv. myricae]|nr:hypothetical protein ALO62_100489 [Pseudomonas amygdali pv. myricae]RMT46918.1 hypothetical protein ALP46_100369 [Pseudomonas amygdali pv. myricae]RMV29405.1 hypothetical protein ALP14_100339 [Pseudomonas amygdali pv. myricae]